MRFGVCCGPGSFAPQVEGQALSAVPVLMESLREAGADYVEFGVASVMTGDDGEFDALRAALQPHMLEPNGLRVEAFNSFIPARHRITGPEVDLGSVLDYCRTALPRCRALGGEVVVLGSAGARKVPEGFDAARAEEQFVEFCRELGRVAEEAGITVAIEPLNRREDNLVLSVEHGIRLVDAVGHPRIQLLADLYHMIEEIEPVEHVADAGARLVHTHVADLGRVAPGYAPQGEADFVGFFRNVHRAGFDGRCSFEGSFADIATQTKPMLELLRRRWEESG